MQTYLDFEKGLAEIEGKAEELRTMARKNAETNVDDEAAALDRKAATLLDDLYRSLDPWRKTLVARHPSGRTARTTSTASSANGRRLPATAPSPTTTR